MSGARGTSKGIKLGNLLLAPRLFDPGREEVCMDWTALRSRGVEVRMLASRERRLWVDDLRALLDDRTRIVSLSFVEFASGFRNDLESIGTLCRERGVLFFVDGIQGLGVLPLDLQRTPI